MALERNVGPDWSDALTLTADTIFQVHAGAVYLALDATTAPADLDDGLLLVQDPMRPLRDSVTIPSGVAVRWRRAGERTTKLYHGAVA